MLEDEKYRDELQSLALLIRDVLADHNSDSLGRVIDEIQGDETGSFTLDDILDHL